MSKVYHYNGPDDLLGSRSERHNVQKQGDIRQWITKTQQDLDAHSVVATFVVDTEGKLWITDRRSEHVACAAGKSVLSAGEMTFLVEEKQVTVEEVTN